MLPRFERRWAVLLRQDLAGAGGTDRTGEPAGDRAGRSETLPSPTRENALGA